MALFFKKNFQSSMLPLFFSLFLGFISYFFIPTDYKLFISIFISLSFFAIFFIISNNDLKDIEFNLKQKYIDLTLFLMLICFDIFVIADIQNKSFRNVIVLLIISIIPGYLLIKLIHLDDKFCLGEIFLVSFFLGIFLMGTLWFILLILDFPYKTGFITIFLNLCGLFILLSKNKKEFSINLNLYAIFGFILIFSFNIFILITLYPDFLHIFSDITRLYQQSIIFHHSIEKFESFEYILYFSFESCYVFFAKGTIIQNIEIFYLINWLSPIAVYYAAKKIFKNKRKIPILATLFYALLNSNWGGGLSLIFYLIQVRSNPDLSRLEILNNVAFRTQYSTRYSMINLWFVPNFLALMLIFVIIIVVLTKNLGFKKRFIILTILYIESYLLHFSEGPIICGFITLFYLIYPIKIKQFQELIISGIIATIFVITFFFLLEKFQIFTYFTYNIQYLASTFLPLMLFVFSMLANYFLNNFGIYKKIKKIKVPLNICSKIFAFSLLVIFIIANIYRFKMYSIVDEAYDLSILSNSVIPWYNYAYLGINFMISALGFLFLFEKKSYNRKMHFFSITFVMSFIFGTLITIINSNIYYTGYSEKRFVQFYSISMCFLAAYGLYYLYKAKFKEKIKNIKMQKIMQKITKISTILLLGSSLIFNINFHGLNIEFWSIYSNSSMAIEESEWNAIEEMEDIINEFPSGGVLVLSLISYRSVHYSGSTNIYPYYTISQANQTYDYINFKLNYRFGDNPIFFYINFDRDSGFLSHFGDDFKEILNSGPVLYNNSNVLIVGPHYAS